MKKIVHLHTDPKFFYDVSSYQNKLFENEIIVLGKDINVKNINIPVTIFDPINEDIEIIINFISNFDAVVIANLTPFNKKLVLKIPKKVKIFWRFFGYELYSTRLDLMLSDTSIKASKNDYGLESTGIKKVVNSLWTKLIFFLKSYKYHRKIDYILLFSSEEYEFLNKHWSFIPKFLRLPLYNGLEYKFLVKENNFILGNSRSIFNNHLNLIDIVKKKDAGFNIKMFLSYGPEKNYYQNLSNEIAEIPYIDKITDFMTSQDFTNIYEKSSALVMNAYRQMALGNIFIAIQNNCKIYLSSKNPIKSWLEKNGLKIFSIEQFEEDYNDGNLFLTDEDARNNISKFNEIYANYNVDMFCKKINEILN